MRVYLNSNLSILECIYLNTFEGNREKENSKVYSLKSELCDADIVVGCKKEDLFYDKIIFINNDNYSKDNLTVLSKYNKVISRFTLPPGIVQDYQLLPYDKLVLEEFRFNGISNQVMSKLSISKFLLHKDDKGYYLQKPKHFMATKIKGDLTIIGMLKLQDKMKTDE
jgi:hypothetical protein